MSFQSGSFTFRRFAVVAPAGSNKAPKTVDQAVLDKLAEHTLRDRELGVPEDLEYGWSGGRHIFDNSFSFESNVYNDCLIFALRIDTNKMPGAIKNAYQQMEEDVLAAGNPSGFISKNQKREARDTVARKCDEELRGGKHRRSKLIPVLWDLTTQTLLSPCPIGNFDKLCEIFNRTFGLDLQPLTAGFTGLRILDGDNKRREYEDLRPTKFVSGPEPEAFPEYLWVARGPEPKDFLGNEFLTWLWWNAEANEGIVSYPGGESTIMIDRQLDMDCAYGMTGKDSLKGDGPTKMPEARDAFRSGKLPRKAGMILHTQGCQYAFAFGAEQLSFGGMKLPDVEEAETARVLVEERITLLRDFLKAFDGMYRAFIDDRVSNAWEKITKQIAGVLGGKSSISRAAAKVLVDDLYDTVKEGMTPRRSARWRSSSKANRCPRPSRRR